MLKGFQHYTSELTRLTVDSREARINLIAVVYIFHNTKATFTIEVASRGLSFACSLLLVREITALCGRKRAHILVGHLLLMYNLNQKKQPCLCLSSHSCVMSITSPQRVISFVSYAFPHVH